MTCNIGMNPRQNDRQNARYRDFMVGVRVGLIAGDGPAFSGAGGGSAMPTCMGTSSSRTTRSPWIWLRPQDCCRSAADDRQSLSRVR